MFAFLLTAVIIVVSSYILYKYLFKPDDLQNNATTRGTLGQEKDKEKWKEAEKEKEKEKGKEKEKEKRRKVRVRKKTKDFQ
ncbi:hypothetical protein RFI_22809 [Reticulomyxa filosa]|uniref:Uncharacterized protein n=1 Tax=Reticulomyxa filosa TaxID=46433 RepID=X6MKL5_RETFI|nr:hypothetical protein RFI_22809 [Reticulomyxa filosa]|eukprot:ETO14558.1 hypothetical protein RFI_22809 [Reticulomyxa filosa]